MKNQLALIVLLACCCVSGAETTADPAQQFADVNGLSRGDRIKKIEVDLTGKGRKDLLLAYQDPNPDLVEREARRQEGGVLFWQAYVNNGDGQYIISNGIETGGTVEVGTELPFRPDDVYLGNVPEMDGYGLVTFYMSNLKREPTTVSLVAYVWDKDHFIKRELARYLDGEQNPIFDKYFSLGNRARIQVHDYEISGGVAVATPTVPPVGIRTAASPIPTEYDKRGRLWQSLNNFLTELGNRLMSQPTWIVAILILAAILMARKRY